MDEHLCESEPPKQSAKQKKVPVRKDSLQVFARMFSDSTAASGMTSWKDVVAALVDAGFSAACVGGSGVIFKDQRTNMGSIKFDRPHPESSVSPNIMRVMGKRLGKWFGWGNETFTLRSKEDA